MIDAATKYKNAVVIGGGLLGLEAANGLMLRGMNVTVVHVMPTLMERQLDSVAGKMLQKSLQDRGLTFLMGAQTQELMGSENEGKAGRKDAKASPKGRVRAVRFKDATEVAAELAEKMRLHVNRGIVVNDTLQTTTDARIYSVGECAAHRGIA